MAAVSIALYTALSSSVAVTESIEKINVYANRQYFEESSNRYSQQDFVNVEVQSNLARTIADYIEVTPGVSLNGQGGLFQSYSIRGFSRSRIRSEVDGVPIFTDRRAGNSLSFLAPDFIESISIKKGPSSALFGSDAMGGVVSASLKHNVDRTLKLQYQPQDNSVDISTYGDINNSTLGFNYRKADNAYSPDGSSLNTEFEQFSGYVKSNFELNDLKAQVSAIVSQSDDIGKSSALYPDERITVYPSDLHTIVTASLTDEKDWYLKLFHHYQNWDSEVTRPLKRVNNTYYQSHTIGGLYYFYTELISEKDRIGFEWVSRAGVSIDELETDLSSDFSYRDALLQGSQDNLAIFLNSSWQVNNKIDIDSGLRLDGFIQKNNLIDQKNNYDAINGNVSLNYQLTDTFSLSGEIGTGFRIPTLSELYFSGETPRGSTLGNPDLNPEKNIGFSFSSNWHYDDIRFKFNAYRNQVTDYIERVRISDDIRSYINVDQAVIQGFEFYTAWSQSDNIDHSLAYQWQEGKDNSNNIIADLNPPELNYNFAYYANAVTLNNSIRYRFEQTNFASGEQALPSVVIWDADLTWEVLDELSMSLSANNILNKNYRTSADEDTAFQMERRFALGLTYQF
jgi:iron complex outermembrane receptor protein